MSFLLFFFKVFVFNLLFSQLLALALRPWARRSAGTPGRAFPDALTCAVLLGLCFAQGLIVGAGVQLSLAEHPESFRTLWFFVGLGCFLPVTLRAYPKDDKRIRGGQMLGYAGAGAGYLVATVFTSALPGPLLAVSELLAV